MILESSVRNMMRKVVLTTTILLALGAGFLFYAVQWFNAPLDLPEDDFVYVLAKGGSLSRVSHDLDQQGILRHGRWLSLYGRLSGRTAIHAGEYRLTSA